MRGGGVCKWKGALKVESHLVLCLCTCMCVRWVCCEFPVRIVVFVDELPQQISSEALFAVQDDNNNNDDDSGESSSTSCRVKKQPEMPK